MTHKTNIPAGWWIIPALTVSLALWVAIAWLMAAMINAAAQWGAM